MHLGVDGSVLYHANFWVYQKKIVSTRHEFVSKRHDDYEYSPLKAALSKLFPCKDSFFSFHEFFPYYENFPLLSRLSNNINFQPALDS